MLKEIRIDYELYQKEHSKSRISGFRDGVGEARRVFLELLAGAKIENLDIGDDEELHRLAVDLEPRIRMAKEQARRKAKG